MKIPKNKKEETCMEKLVEHHDDVENMMYHIARILEILGRGHDKSKFDDPEFSIYAESIPKLAKLEYGSKEYHKALEEIKPALDVHYANNDHHPEFFANGIKDMNLIQILHMFVDWYCATKKHDTGNIRQSIEKNRERFDYTKELEQIFINTVPVMENLDKKK